MPQPRGIAVIDIGYTHSKVMHFGTGLELIGEHKVESAHSDDTVYPSLDLEPFLPVARQALAEFDARLPIDRIVTSAHGSGLALVKGGGTLALPVMDYAAQPPQDVVKDYAEIAPPFGEVCAPLLPGALTLGLQLFWQQQKFGNDFAQTEVIMPWAQYAAWRLGGRASTEFTALGAQTQLLDVRRQHFSSLAVAKGWNRLFAPRAQAFDIIGEFDGELQGEGKILAGIHDSNANYLRYLATGAKNFTLLSTGTWIIGFTPGIDLSTIDPARDVVSNTDYLGRPVASCRFMGGKEFEVGAKGADPALASLTLAAQLIGRSIMALPSFTDSGGPIPNTGGKGRITGGKVENDAELASLMSLYCALMSWQSLTAVGGDSDVIVDGPFARNEVYLGGLAGLLAPRRVSASMTTQGTAVGAALLARCGMNGELHHLPADLKMIHPPEIAGLAPYAQRWLENAAG